MRLSRGNRDLARNLFDDPEEFRAPLIEHLEELRNRIIRSVLFLGVGWAIGWYLEPSLYAILFKVISTGIHRTLDPSQEFKVVFTNVTEPFLLKIKLAFFIGLILSFPLITLQIWGFVAPGLKASERAPFRRLAPMAVLLFLVGASFCWAILPAAIGWFNTYLGDYKGASLFQDPQDIILFVTKMVFAFGLGFQLPLVVWVLGALNLLSAETLIQYWRQGAVFIFVFAGIVTPSNDPLSMLMMAMPLTLLFIISVYAVKFTQRKQKRIKPESD